MDYYNDWIPTPQWYFLRGAYVGVSVIPGLTRDPGNNNESSFAGSPHTRG